MKKLIPVLVSGPKVLVACALAVAVAQLVGCASSSGGAAATPAKPGEPVALDGADYKLLAAGGGLDGRVVEFVERGNTIRGCLVKPGNKLRSASGVEMGTWVFSLTQKGPNEYEGVYRAIGPDASVQEKQVALNFAGDSMSWNQESATWERQSDTKQLTDEQKKRCVAR